MPGFGDQGQRMGAQSGDKRQRHIGKRFAISESFSIRCILPVGAAWTCIISVYAVPIRASMRLRQWHKIKSAELSGNGTNS